MNEMLKNNSNIYLRLQTIKNQSNEIINMIRNFPPVKIFPVANKKTEMNIIKKYIDLENKLFVKGTMSKVKNQIPFNKINLKPLAYSKNIPKINESNMPNKVANIRFLKAVKTEESLTVFKIYDKTIIGK